MILRRHVQFQILQAMLLASAVLLVIQTLFAFLAQVDNLSDTYTLTKAFTFVLWSTPVYFVQVMPLAALVGAVLGLGALSNQGEVTVMRASGVNLFRVVRWALSVAFFWVLTTLAVNQFVLPGASFEAEQIRAETKGRSLSTLSGYWNKQGSDIIFVDQANATGEISGLSMWRFEDDQLTELLYAPNAQFDPASERWLATDVNRTDLRSNQQLGASLVSRPEALSISLPINPQDLYLLTRDPSELSITDLSRFISMNEKNAQDVSQHRLMFWQKLLSPFAVLPLVMVASAFVFGSLRSSNSGLRLTAALLCGLLFSYLQELFGYLSLLFKTSPVPFVLAPMIVFGVVGYYLIKRKQ
jgi:lipopolysaccharide export system permease protein